MLQLSATLPHLPVHVIAVGLLVQPHTLAVGGLPPPQELGALQLPQDTVMLHPTLTVPQFFPAHA
jgi:hypothetical protein